MSEEQRDDFHDALANLGDKVENLERRAQLNEIKFHYEDYKDVSVYIYMYILFHWDKIKNKKITHHFFYIIAY